MWRPESGHLTEKEPECVNRWRCKIERMIHFGAQIEYTVSIGSQSLRILSPSDRVLNVGAQVWLSVKPVDVQFLTDK